jgi:putative transposase
MMLQHRIVERYTMSNTLSCLYYHIVFSTKNRQLLLNNDLHRDLQSYTAKILENENCQLLKWGGTEDHVHLVVLLKPAYSPADIVRIIKSNTSRLLRSAEYGINDFSWQGGYGIFTVSESQLGRLTHYIANQEQHHQRL